MWSFKKVDFNQTWYIKSFFKKDEVKIFLYTYVGQELGPQLEHLSFCGGPFVLWLEKSTQWTWNLDQLLYICIRFIIQGSLLFRLVSLLHSKRMGIIYFSFVCFCEEVTEFSTYMAEELGLLKRWEKIVRTNVWHDIM